MLLQMEKLQLDKNALHSMYCEGYTDIDGEWNSISGNYYCYLQRSLYDINHNYEVRIRRIKKGKWDLRVYLCLVATNSKDILLFQEINPTLKKSKATAIAFIQEYDVSEKAKEDIENWKSQYASPVFIVKSDGEPLLLGTTYNYIGNDSQKTNTNFTYYNEDMPNYHLQLSRPFYQICKAYDDLYLSCCEISSYGYCSSGIKDDALLKKMLEIIKPMSKYQHIFQFLEKKAKKQ